MKYLLMSAAMLLLVTGCKPGNGKSREEVCETDMTRAGQEIKNDSVANIADSIQLYFTYPLPDGTEYGYTFLEFGAVGCAPCKKMEKEMETIRKDFEGKVNVRFINLSKNGTKTGPNILRYTPYRHRSFSTVRERKYTGMSDIYLLTN